MIVEHDHGQHQHSHSKHVIGKYLPEPDVVLRGMDQFLCTTPAAS